MRGSDKRRSDGVGMADDGVVVIVDGGKKRSGNCVVRMRHNVTPRHVGSPPQISTIILRVRGSPRKSANLGAGVTVTP